MLEGQLIDVEALRPNLDVWENVPAILPDLPDAIWFGLYQRVGRERHPLRVIVSVDLGDTWEIGNWLHLSISRTSRLPTWADLARVRDELGYGEREFVQLVPPGSSWLNLAGYTLHLLHRLDAPVVPRPLWEAAAGAGGVAYGKPGALDGRG